MIKKEDVISALYDQNLPIGRMVAGSKSGYRNAYPNNMVIFNANVFTEEHGKIWYGDLDITLSAENLQSVVDLTKTSLYVLYEMDGRFEAENITFKKVESVAAYSFHPAL